MRRTLSRQHLVDVFQGRRLGYIDGQGHVRMALVRSEMRRGNHGSPSGAADRALATRLAKDTTLREVARHCAAQGWFREGQVTCIGGERYEVTGVVQ